MQILENSEFNFRENMWRATHFSEKKIVLGSTSNVIFILEFFAHYKNLKQCKSHYKIFYHHFLWKDLALTADLNCLNMLFVIQWRNIKLWGPSLKKLTLTEVEFLHPQTLNPFALQCRNLTEMIIINPRWSPFAMNSWVGKVKK